MENKTLLVVSFGSTTKELDHLKNNLEVSVDHLIIRRGIKDVTIPNNISGIFYCKDIDADDIRKIVGLVKSDIPMARVLNEIYTPVIVKRVKTCNTVDLATNYFKDCFSNS